MSQSQPSPTVPPDDIARQVDRLTDRFADACRDGQDVLPECLLAEASPEARPELLRRLLRIEIDHRHKLGRPLSRPEAEGRLAGLGPWVLELLDSYWPDDGRALTLEVVGGPLVGGSYRLAGHSTFLVGRGPAGVQLALEGDPGISRTHFLVEYNPPRARLVDLRSKNGTFVNGVRIGETDLSDGDEIRAGKTTFRVRFPPGPGQHTVTLGSEWTTPPAPPRPALLLPGYEVLCELGRGGMGVVYKARRPGGEVVAIKTVLPAVTPRAEAFTRFQREMAILQRLTHPHIVRFLAAGEAGGLLYFVMEYVEGQSAGHLVKQSGPFAAERVVALGGQLLEALAHAHLQGFIHRDVKPGNLLLTRCDGREEVKLADFGLGRAYQVSAMSGLTISGQPGGTPGFMPPEQVSDFRSAQPSSDQYGVAATLYYLLTGQLIYEPVASTVDLFVRILQDEPIPLRQPYAGPPLPERLASVLRRALARDPRQRFPDVLAMRDALVRAL